MWDSYDPSVPDAILGRSYTSLRVFKALGQFREIERSPQIMGMTKQKVLQNIHIHVLRPNWSLSNS